MTVVHDAATEHAFTTTTPATFTHTPVGTPAGITLFINVYNTATDAINGAVTYGGVAMTRIDRATDAVGELLQCFEYFLGSGIPTGAQTVSISHTGTTAEKHAVCISVTAAGNTTITTFGKLQADQADPQIALDTSATSSLRYAGIMSGASNIGDLVPLSGMTVVHDIDMGARVSRVDRQTTAATGSFTIGWTAASDGVAMVAVAVQESAAPAAADPFPYIGGGYYPTEG